MTVERSAGPEGLSFSGSVRMRGSGTWVYVAGNMGMDDSGAIVPGGLAAQARAALGHVLRAVAEAGGAAADVLKITAYLTSLADYHEYNEVRGEVFGPTPPASTSVAVAGLIQPDAIIEIDAVAFVPDPE